MRLLAHSRHVDGVLCRAVACRCRRHLHELTLVLRFAAFGPQTWGEQTDVPESADGTTLYIIARGSNVPQTRTPDAHFFLKRYNGTKTVAVTPDYSEVAKLSDNWMPVRQGTDSALAMAMGHVILKEFHLTGKSEYFDDYCRMYTDMPFLVMLEDRDGDFAPSRTLRAADFKNNLGEKNNPAWKPVMMDVNTDWPWFRMGDRPALGRKRQMESETKCGGRIGVGMNHFTTTPTRSCRLHFPISALENDQPSSNHDSVLVQRAGEGVKLDGDGGPGRHRRDLMVANYGVIVVGRRQRRGLPGRRRALYAGMAGKNHRYTGEFGRTNRPRVRRQREQDPRPLDGHIGRGD